MNLGILGGGQLARMLALAAAPLGVRVRAFDPSPDACARDVCELVTGGYEDARALARFAQGLDAITYEFENVPAVATRTLEGQATVRPGSTSLLLSQDRVLEKRALADAGFAVAPWQAVDDAPSLARAIEQVGTPAILKTRTGGYDGKGQAIIATPADAGRAHAAIEHRPAILEAMLAFERELSLVCVRDAQGQAAFYPLVENEHRQGILRITIAPAPGVDPGLQRRAQQLAGALLDALGHVGVLTIEFFLVGGPVGGRLVANEFAPRVHNSGHWTLDGAATSQFENHVRAVLGLPLGPTTLRTPTVMLNCVGQMPDAARVLADPGAKLHDYRKPPRPGRKVGHVNLLGVDGSAAKTTALKAAERLGIDLG